MKKKFLACIMVLAIAVAFMPANTFAASKTAKMKAYDQVIKSGNTVYCAGAEGLYKVKVKKGKVVSKKVITRAESFGAYSYFKGMKKKGSYIYVQSSTEGTLYCLDRIKTKSGACKTLASANDQGPIVYAIKGKKIYYKASYSKTKKVMKLNGKHKKKTSTKPVMKHSKSNARGYSVIMKEKGDKVVTYLKTPKGKFRLGSHEKW